MVERAIAASRLCKWRASALPAPIASLPLERRACHYLELLARIDDVAGDAAALNCAAEVERTAGPSWSAAARRISLRLACENAEDIGAVSR